MAPRPRRRPASSITALDIGSSKVSALIAEPGEDGELIVLGTGQRESRGVKRGFIADMERDRSRDPRGGRAGRADRRHQRRGCLGRLLGGRPGQRRRRGRGRARRPPDRAATISTHLLGAGRDSIDPRGADGAPRAAGALHARRARRASRSRSGSMPTGSASTSMSSPPIRSPVRNLDLCVRSAHLGVEVDRRLAGRRRHGLPERGGARARRRAGRAGRGRHQRLGVRRRHAGRPDVAPDRRRRHHRRHRLRLRHPPRRRPSG